jgi:hypothetical protein
MDPELQPRPPVSSIGIMSTPYSGTTLVSIVLGRARGVLFTSEVFQLRNKGKRTVGCKACGPSCSFWSLEFLDLCRESSQCYDRIVDRARTLLGSTHVIFKEGGWNAYDTHLREGNRFDRFILLMKCPQAYAYSCSVHQDLPVTASLEKYSREYRGALDFVARTRIPTTVVHFDAFAEEPASQTQRICDHLGIPYTPELLDLGWKDWMHPLAAGNAGAFSHLRPREEFELGVEKDPFWQRVYKERHIAWIRQHHGTISPDRKWEEGLSAAQKAEVERHDGAMSVFDTLRGLAAGAAF